MNLPNLIVGAARFDSATLITMAVAVLAMASIVTFAARMPDGRIGERVVWASGFLLGSVGFALMLIAPSESRSLAREVSNLMFLMGYGLCYAGARGVAGKPPLHSITVAGGVVWVIAAWVLDIAPVARMPLVSGIVGLYSLASAAEFRYRAQPEEFARRAAAGLCATHGIFYMMRALLGPNFGLGEQWSENALSIWGGVTSFEAILFSGGLAMLVFAIMRESAAIEARSLAATDPLTGIGNRRAFHVTAPPLLAVAARFRPALFLMDIDGFKAVNDRCGHDAGDRLLMGLVRNIERELPDRRLFWRLGGDEFAIMLNEADHMQIRAMAERIRRAVADYEDEVGGIAVRVSTTLGIAVHKPGMSIDELLRCADTALYRGKSEGRNRIFEHASIRPRAA